MAPLTKEQKRQVQIEKARTAFDQKQEHQIVASTCHFERQTHMVVIEFSIGSEYRFPPDIVQGLNKATDDQLSNIELFPSGSVIRWPELDVDLSIPLLLEGIFGSKKWMATLNSSKKATSEAKKAASHKNGTEGRISRQRGLEKI